MKRKLILLLALICIFAYVPVTVQAQEQETEKNAQAYTYRPTPRINRSGTISYLGFGWGGLTGDNNWLGETLRVEYVGATSGIEKVNIKVLDQKGNQCGSVKYNVSKGDYVTFPLMIWEGTWTIHAQSTNGVSGDIYIYMKSFI